MNENDFAMGKRKNAQGSVPSRLFVMGGGGLPGMDMLCGMLLALHYASIKPTTITGTSAGAIIGAFLAAGHCPTKIRKILLELNETDVLKERFLWKLRVLWIDYFIRADRIKRLLERYLPFRFSDLDIPLAVTATNMETSRASWFQHDSVNLREAVLASMSISGVFPPVKIMGKWFSDGGTAANLPLPGDWRDYDEVYLLVPNPPVKYTRKRENILSRLMRNLHFYGEDQIQDVWQEVSGHLNDVGKKPRVFFIRPNIGLKRGILKFDHHRLMSEAFSYTHNYLEGVKA